MLSLKVLTVQEHSLFSTPFPAFLVCRYFDAGHSDQCEEISHFNFDLHFSNSEQCWASFYVFISHVLVFSKKAMATHSSSLAWKIPWTEEPGRLQSLGLLRVGHDWAPSLLLFTFMHWRRKWQPTPVFLPGESQGWGSLVGCHRWCHTESNMTEMT